MLIIIYTRDCKISILKLLFCKLQFLDNKKSLYIIIYNKKGKLHVCMQAYCKTNLLKLRSWEQYAIKNLIIDSKVATT